MENSLYRRYLLNLQTFLARTPASAQKLKQQTVRG